MTPLELFFDLVFVLAFTQCTALMAHHPTWSGLAQGLLVLGMLWWSWIGYAWLTSVIDPEEGAVRLVMFGAMAALLIVSLCVLGGLRQPRPRLRPHLRRSCGSPRSGSSCSPAPTTTSCATRCSGSAVSTAIAIGLARDRLVLRRPRPGRDLAARPRPRHGRPLPVRLRGLETRARGTSPSATA